MESKSNYLIFHESQAHGRSPMKDQSTGQQQQPKGKDEDIFSIEIPTRQLHQTLKGDQEKEIQKTPTIFKRERINFEKRLDGFTQKKNIARKDGGRVESVEPSGLKAVMHNDRHFNQEEAKIEGQKCEVLSNSRFKFRRVSAGDEPQQFSTANRCLPNQKISKPNLNSSSICEYSGCANEGDCDDVREDETVAFPYKTQNQEGYQNEKNQYNHPMRKIQQPQQRNNYMQMTDAAHYSVFNNNTNANQHEGRSSNELIITPSLKQIAENSQYQNASTYENKFASNINESNEIINHINFQRHDIQRFSSDLNRFHHKDAIVEMSPATNNQFMINGRSIQDNIETTTPPLPPVTRLDHSLNQSPMASMSGTHNHFYMGPLYQISPQIISRRPEQKTNTKSVKDNHIIDIQKFEQIINKRPLSKFKANNDTGNLISQKITQQKIRNLGRKLAQTIEEGSIHISQSKSISRQKAQGLTQVSQDLMKGVYLSNALRTNQVSPIRSFKGNEEGRPKSQQRTQQSIKVRRHSVIGGTQNIKNINPLAQLVGFNIGQINTKDSRAKKAVAREEFQSLKIAEIHSQLQDQQQRADFSNPSRILMNTVGGFPGHDISQNINLPHRNSQGITHEQSDFIDRLEQSRRFQNQSELSYSDINRQHFHQHEGIDNQPISSASYMNCQGSSPTQGKQDKKARGTKVKATSEYQRSIDSQRFNNDGILFTENSLNQPFNQRDDLQSSQNNDLSHAASIKITDSMIVNTSASRQHSLQTQPNESNIEEVKTLNNNEGVLNRGAQQISTPIVRQSTQGSKHKQYESLLIQDGHLPEIFEVDGENLQSFQGMVKNSRDLRVISQEEVASTLNIEHITNQHQPVNEESSHDYSENLINKSDENAILDSFSQQIKSLLPSEGGDHLNSFVSRIQAVFWQNIMEVFQENTRLKAFLDGEQRQNQLLLSQLDYLNGEVKQKDRELNEKNIKLERKDNEINQKNEDITRRKLEKKRLKKQLEEINAQMACMRDQIHQLSYRPQPQLMSLQPAKSHEDVFLERISKSPTNMTTRFENTFTQNMGGSNINSITSHIPPSQNSPEINIRRAMTPTNVANLVPNAQTFGSYFNIQNTQKSVTVLDMLQQALQRSTLQVPDNTPINYNKRETLDPSKVPAAVARDDLRSEPHNYMLIVPSRVGSERPMGSNSIINGSFVESTCHQKGEQPIRQTNTHNINEESGEDIKYAPLYKPRTHDGLGIGSYHVNCLLSQKTTLIKEVFDEEEEKKSQHASISESQSFASSVKGPDYKYSNTGAPPCLQDESHKNEVDNLDQEALFDLNVLLEVKREAQRLNSISHKKQREQGENPLEPSTFKKLIRYKTIKYVGDKLINAIPQSVASSINEHEANYEEAIKLISDALIDKNRTFASIFAERAYDVQLDPIEAGTEKLLEKQYLIGSEFLEILKNEMNLEFSQRIKESFYEIFRRANSKLVLIDYREVEQYIQFYLVNNLGFKYECMNVGEFDMNRLDSKAYRLINRIEEYMSENDIIFTDLFPAVQRNASGTKAYIKEDAFYQQLVALGIKKYTKTIPSLLNVLRHDKVRKDFKLNILFALIEEKRLGNIYINSFGVKRRKIPPELEAAAAEQTTDQSKRQILEEDRESSTVTLATNKSLSFVQVKQPQ